MRPVPRPGRRCRTLSWDQCGQIVLEALEVEAATAVADVAVRSNQVLSASSSAEPCQRGPARVAQGTRERLGAEPGHDDQAPVAALEPCQPVLIPGSQGAAQQQMEPWPGEGLVQAAGNLVPEQPE